MAQSRARSTTDPAKSLAGMMTNLQRRVRELELRDDASISGGSGTVPALTWAGIDYSDANGHLSSYLANPAEFAMDGNFCYLRGGVKYVSGWDSNTDTLLVPGAAPVHHPQFLPGILVKENVTLLGMTSPEVGFSGSDGTLMVDAYSGGTASTFGIFFLDGLFYSIA